MKSTMTAKRLRAVLLAGMLAIIVLAVAGFVFAQNSLNNYALEISKQNADAQTGDQNIQTLRKLETVLTERQSIVQKANSIVAENSTYADRAISDITRIAAQSGVSLGGFEFIGDAAATGAATGAPTAPATPVAGAPVTAAPTTAPAGVSKKSISVTLGTPLKYSSLMKFIDGIENNSLRMQIKSVSMTKDQDDMVGTQPFVIEVYVQ